VRVSARLHRAEARARLSGTGLGLAGLVVVLVGLDQAVQDPGQVADITRSQRLDEVAADPVGVPGPAPAPDTQPRQRPPMPATTSAAGNHCRPGAQAAAPDAQNAGDLRAGAHPAGTRIGCP